jgi:hypothetical protein
VELVVATAKAYKQILKDAILIFFNNVEIIFPRELAN